MNNEIDWLPKCLMLMAAVFLAFAATFMLVSCSWFTPKRIDDIGKIVTCVLDHSLESPETIAIECGVANVSTVIDILSAHKRANMRGISL